MYNFQDDPMYEDKYTVLNRKYVLQSLNGGELHQLDQLLRKIKQPNKYLVVNQDERYAKDVWDIIRENETKEIVAFIGRAGAGKDYQCQKLVEQGFTKMAFADALREIAFNTLGYTYEYGMEHYDELKANEVVNGLNFRQVLERLGTEGIRKYDNDFWVKCLVNNIKDKKVCISDMRFYNEYAGLRQFAIDNNYKLKVILCDYKSDRYQRENPHKSARMGNYFAERYDDLTVITDEQMEKYRKVEE